MPFHSSPGAQISSSGVTFFDNRNNTPWAKPRPPTLWTRFSQYFHVLYIQSPTLFWTNLSCVVIFVLWKFLPRLYQRSFLHVWFLNSQRNTRRTFGLSLVLSAFSHESFTHLLANLLTLSHLGPSVAVRLKYYHSRRFFQSTKVATIVTQMWPLVLSSAMLCNLAFLLSRGPRASCLGLSGVTMSLLAMQALWNPHQVFRILVFGVIPVTLQARHVLQALLFVSVFGCWIPHTRVAHVTHLAGLLYGMVYHRFLMAMTSVDPQKGSLSWGRTVSSNDGRQRVVQSVNARLVAVRSIILVHEVGKDVPVLDINRKVSLMPVAGVENRGVIFTDQDVISVVGGIRTEIGQVWNKIKSDAGAESLIQPVDISVEARVVEERAVGVNGNGLSKGHDNRVEAVRGNSGNIGIGTTLGMSSEHQAIIRVGTLSHAIMKILNGIFVGSGGQEFSKPDPGFTELASGGIVVPVYINVTKVKVLEPVRNSKSGSTESHIATSTLLGKNDLIRFIGVELDEVVFGMSIGGCSSGIVRGVFAKADKSAAMAETPRMCSSRTRSGQLEPLTDEKAKEEDTAKMAMALLKHFMIMVGIVRYRSLAGGWFECWSEYSV
eukprot:Nitzschia sp. Nitz4//scaffold94_size78252//19549//21556//NITZ4_005462-RA/size78252-snap-gene-0.130-mRNA-1//-1//CDS//3329560362//1772//frame0